MLNKLLMDLDVIEVKVLSNVKWLWKCLKMVQIKSTFHILDR